MNRYARIVASMSVAMVLAFGSSASAQMKDPAMEKLAADWTAAFARADVKALGSYYTENAVRVTPQAGAVVGRAAIEKEFVANFAGPWRGTKIKVTVGSTQTVGTDIAVNEGTYEVTGIMMPDGKPAPPLKGRYLNTIVKKNGAWVIAGNAGVDSPPPPPTK